VLKEGVGRGFRQQGKIAKLLRFAAPHRHATKTVSLADYIGRMKEGQDKIYYITADSFAAAKNSPHLEIFRKKGIEVLLLSDRVDEWLVGNLHRVRRQAAEVGRQGRSSIWASSRTKPRRRSTRPTPWSRGSTANPTKTASPTGPTCCSSRRCWQKAASSTIRRALCGG
jgi:hypothetical protein